MIPCGGLSLAGLLRFCAVACKEEFVSRFTRSPKPQTRHLQDVALPEPAGAVLRKAGVIEALAVQSKAAEPAIGQVEMHLLAQSRFRADTHGLTDDQHPDQFVINEGRPVVL